VTGALLGEGTSDRALLPILRWLVAQISSADIRLEWVDSSRFAWPRRTLAEKVRLALLACPCDLLFVHRDADNQHPALRHAEIANAVGTQRFVAVVPIRETEAWLLIDESAILAAAGRARESSPLELPPTRRIEDVSDPKRRLHDTLRPAHAAVGRRARRFDPATAAHRVADLVEDWSPLRELSAFQRLETDTRAALLGLGLPSDDVL
jgi:hypothetical protein